MKSFEARKELNSLRADESLSHEDSRLYLFNILEDPSSCEVTFNKIVMLRESKGFGGQALAPLVN